MAIKRTTEKFSKTDLPKALSDFCKKTFTSDAMAKFFESQAKAGKSEIKEYLESNTDGFDFDLSKSKTFECEEGKVTFATRKRYDYDPDKIIALVKNGDIPLETLVNCISSFKDKDLQTAIGSKFDDVSTLGYTEFLQLKANDTFKAKIAEIIGVEVEVEESSKQKVKKVKSNKETSSETSSDSETSLEVSLEDILNGRI